MAARTSKKTAVIDPNSVSIADFCQSQGINEQIFRLELMQHLDNADSAKTVKFDVAQTVASTIQATSKALPETTATPENLTPQAIQPAQETATGEPQKPQNSSIAASTPKAISSPVTGANIPTALEELIQESEEVIELADLVHTYRNAQIIQNAQSRDSELVGQLRERRLETRHQVFDSLRGLNARQPVAQDLPELPSSLSEEIKALSDELGKQLHTSK
ncbi:hypothetical protein FJR38_27165 [Anabaena sp. UHCC 0253]|uniref:hypothetical protein n=1 Tax=Anabaena sp. UHCC 0253 TaxID=2590019 RepID=UPI0014488266|nr:hypothetical protein [Anabaena sp. UHCC 0253]MTJ56061.1 hypothetical protein [Anabaena sp. UHCC 0253]